MSIVLLSTTVDLVSRVSDQQIFQDKTAVANRVVFPFLVNQPDHMDQVELMPLTGSVKIVVVVELVTVLESLVADLISQR